MSEPRMVIGFMLGVLTEILAKIAIHIGEVILHIGEGL